LRQLKFLFLGDNKMTSLPVEIFDKVCLTIKALSIAGNSIDKFPREALRKCSILSHLNLGYNQVNIWSFEAFATHASKDKCY
jgi:Leucine-rich repeat (LRR) protein